MPKTNQIKKDGFHLVEGREAKHWRERQWEPKILEKYICKSIKNIFANPFKYIANHLQRDCQTLEMYLQIL